MRQPISSNHRWPATAAVVAVTVCVLSACSGSTTKSQSTSATAPRAAPTTSQVATGSTTSLLSGVIASIPLPAGGSPLGIIAGFGSMWVQTHRNHVLYRIDPNSNTVVASIDMGQTGCGLAAGLDRIWVTHCGTSKKALAVDPATNQIVGSFEGSSVDPVTDFGSVWVESNGFDALLRIDPKTYTATASIPLKGFAIVSGGGSIWTAFVDPRTGDYGGTITQVDPTTNRTVRTIETGPAGSYPDMFWAFSALWLKGTDDGRLIRVDPTSGKVTTNTIAGFLRLSDAFDVVPVVSGNSLLARTADGTVSQLDPTTAKVTATYPADAAGGGGHIAVAFGSLWVANFTTNTVWRDRL